MQIRGCAMKRDVFERRKMAFGSVTAPVTAMGIPGDPRGQDFLLNP